MTTPIDLVIDDARIHLPGGDVLEGWLAVADGRVAAIGDGPAPDASATYDAGGRDVIPGVIDTHVHFRDPGDTHKEDFTTGSLSAAFGGITTVLDMPNTGHQVITPDDLREKRDYMAGRSWVDFGLHAGLMDSAEHVRELADLGCASLKWMMGYETWKGMRCIPETHSAIRSTFVEAAAVDMLIQVHAESLGWMQDLVAELRAQGRTDVGAHGDSRPPFVESIAVAEAAILAAEFGARLHVVHTTSRMPLRTGIALRDALGAPVTIETCPSYLFLSHDDVIEQGVAIQVNPPMRSRADQDVMWEAVVSGEIYSIASDHAPTPFEDKDLENAMDALPGVVGVETMLPLLVDAVATGRLTMARLIELLCAHPASLMRLQHRKGALLPGHDADLVVLDLAGRTVVRGEALHSKQRFTPYEGRELRGAIGAVFVRGRQIVEQGELVADGPSGEYVPSRYAPQAAAVAGR